MRFTYCWSKIRGVKVTFEIGSVRLKRQFTVKIAYWDRRKYPSYGEVRLKVVHLTKVFYEKDT